ncbi:MAG: DUF308 domain-containing protein [Methanobacteriaceae archaeon]|nr:DUF308 domain-containing protein [Methanobacteriaceae archaeon]
MLKNRNLLIGLFVIILGIMVMVFPLIGVFAASIIDGIICLLISLWIILHGIQGWKVNRTSSSAFLVLGIIGFTIGFLIIGNINLYSFFFGITFYLAGLILLIVGILFILMGEDRNMKLIGVLGVIVGILSIILGYYSMNPFFVALVIGFFLIVYGILKIMNKV